MFSTFVAVVLAIGLLGLPQARAIDETTIAAVRAAILDGVTELANPNGPGKLVVYGEDAFIVANYGGADERNPLIAGAEWGSGRVLAMGDHQFLNMDNYGGLADSGVLYRNGIEWLADTTDRTIKIVVARSSASQWLADQGFTNVVETRDYVDELADADVLIGWLGSSVSDGDIAQVADFVKQGGGLFLADYGIGYRWWWDGDIPDGPGNRLLREVGIGFADGTTGGLQPSPATRHLTAPDVLDMLEDPSSFSDVELAIGAEMGSRLLEVLQPGDPLLLELAAAYEARSAGIRPTPETPVTDSTDKATLSYLAGVLASTPPDEVTKHPLAETLYGVVPADAPRVAESVSIDASLPRWQATGLYVAPGEVVTVTVPESLVGQGYLLRVNAHTDDISQRDAWERPPVVHRSFPIEATTVQVANAFGGLLFIDLGNTPATTGRVDISITNAVQAPYFELGEHTDAEWNASLRSRPAPFAILVSPNMQISLPKHQVEFANLTEPTELMTWWNDVVALQDDLTAQTRTRAELANVDVQISAGAAHSGYPYQAYEKHWGNMADVSRLTTRGSWGDFHELGHNHQRGWWTFDGDGEVSVNIMSNIAMEQLASAPQGGWSWSTNPELVLAEAIDNVAVGGTYSGKDRRWSFWFQLADGFGWDAYRNVFQGYEADNIADPSLLPTTNAQEKDQWLVRFSNEVGYDLSPFMVDTWGLQVSPEARTAVRHLPGWMPIWTDAEPIVLTATGGASIPIALDANIYAMTEPVLSVVGAEGSVTRVGDRSWTYDPAPGFVARDDFMIVATTSAGNSVEIPVTIENEDLPVGYVSLAPTRLLDSRSGLGEYATPWTGGEQRSLQILGQAGLPTAGVDAVALHVTTVAPAAGGMAPHSWLNAWPAGSQPSATAVHNFGTDAATAELTNDFVIVGVGDNGKIDLSNAHGAVDLVIDVVGYFGPGGSSYVPFTQAFRAIDSRPSTQVGPWSTPWPAGARTITIADETSIPADAHAVALHVTTVNPSSGSMAPLSWLNVYPTGSVPSTTAVHNFGTDPRATSLRNDLIVAKLGRDGAIDIENSHGEVDLVVDVVGYFSGEPGRTSYAAITPERLRDTRLLGDPIGGGEVMAIVDDRLVGCDVAALHVTAVQPDDSLMAPVSWLSSGAESSTSTAVHNFGVSSSTAQLVNDMLFLPVTEYGGVQGVFVKNQFGTVDIVVDLVGIFGEPDSCQLS